MIRSQQNLLKLLKHGGHSIVTEITRLMNSCWRGENVPTRIRVVEWRQGIILKLPKKGDISNCNNWRGITLLSIPGKVFCTILLHRLHDSVEATLHDEQAGFRRLRSCVEQIFTLRKIIEQYAEFQQPLSINFVDFKKAFDSYTGSHCGILPGCMEFPSIM